MAAVRPSECTVWTSDGALVGQNTGTCLPVRRGQCSNPCYKSHVTIPTNWVAVTVVLFSFHASDLRSLSCRSLQYMICFKGKTCVKGLQSECSPTAVQLVLITTPLSYWMEDYRLIWISKKMGFIWTCCALYGIQFIPCLFSLAFFCRIPSRILPLVSSLVGCSGNKGCPCG